MPRRAELARHVRVVEMAMRVDQSRQENRVTEINDFVAVVLAQFFERTDGVDVRAADEHRAVVDRRRANGEDGAGAEEHFVENRWTRAEAGPIDVRLSRRAAKSPPP